jgi:protein TonB
MKRQILLTAIFCGLLSAGAVAQGSTAKPAQGVQTEPGKAKSFNNITPPNKLIPIAEHFPGGQDSLYSYIDKQIRYPLMARRNRLQGECIIAVTLNADGTLTNLKILQNKGGTLGEEALRVVRTLRFNKPGYSNQYSLPIIFKL